MLFFPLPRIFCYKHLVKDMRTPWFSLERLLQQLLRMRSKKQSCDFPLKHFPLPFFSTKCILSDSIPHNSCTSHFIFMFFFLLLFTKYMLKWYQQTKQLRIVKNLKNTNTFTH